MSSMFFFGFCFNGTNSREDTLSYLPIGFSRGSWMEMWSITVITGAWYHIVMYLRTCTYIYVIFICHNRNKVSLSSLYLLTSIGVIEKEKDCPII